jgi:hypothetical protein
VVYFPSRERAVIFLRHLKNIIFWKKIYEKTDEYMIFFKIQIQTLLTQIETKNNKFAYEWSNSLFLFVPM